MEENQSKKCCCESTNEKTESCCEPKTNKNNLLGRIIFISIVSVFAFMLIFKIFINKGENAVIGSKDSTSCCAKDTSSQKPACCSKDKNNE